MIQWDRGLQRFDRLAIVKMITAPSQSSINFRLIEPSATLILSGINRPRQICE